MMEHPVEWLSAYLDDEIDDRARRQIEAHLAVCESCAETLRDMEDIRAQTALLFGTAEPPPDLEQAVRRAIARKSPLRVWLRAGLAVALADAACLAVIWQLFGGIAWVLWTLTSKISLTMVYLVSDWLGSVPSLYGWAAGLALLLISLSGYSLRQLLRSETQ